MISAKFGLATMSEKETEEYQKIYAEIQMKFRARLPGQACGLEDLRHACLVPDTDTTVLSKNLSELLHTAHTLAGQSGTLGHPELSAAASAVEERACTIIQSGKVDDTAELKQLSDLVRTLVGLITDL